MNQNEFDIYNRIFNDYTNSVPLPDIFLYMKLSPSECLKRIAERGRRGEECINLDYLQNLDHNYEDWISGIEKKTTVCRINASESIFDVFNECNKLTQNKH